MDITYYLKIIYTQKNMKYPFLNCWGLVCEFYQREKNKQLDLFEYDDLNSLNICYQAYKDKLTEVSKKDNCIVAFFKNGILFHCGIYLHDDKILHTDRVTSVQDLNQIIRRKNYSGVKYYDVL